MLSRRHRVIALSSRDRELSNLSYYSRLGVSICMCVCVLHPYRERRSGCTHYELLLIHTCMNRERERGERGREKERARERERGRERERKRNNERETETERDRAEK